MSQEDTPSGAASTPSVTTRPLQKLFGFGLTLSASIGSFGFFAVQGILLARLLGPEGRGEFAAAVMFPQVLLYLGLLGAPELIAGYAAEGRANAPVRRTAARYGLAAGLISTATCVLLSWLAIPAEMRHVLPWALVCACAMPLQQIRLSVQAVDHGQRALTRYNNVRLTAAAAFPFFLLLSFIPGWFENPTSLSSENRSPAAVTQSKSSASGEVRPESDTSPSGMATPERGRLVDVSSDQSRVNSRSLEIVCLLFVVSQAFALLLVQFGMDASWFGPGAVPVRTALRDGRGLMGAWFSTELLERLDVVLFMILFPATLGWYVTAIPIAALMIIVPNAAGLYAFNRGARQDERISYADAKRFLGLGLVIQVLCALALAAVLPILLPFVYGAAFSPTVRFAWLLLPAGIFRGLLQAADSYLRARKKPQVGVKARAVGIPLLLAFGTMGPTLLGDAAIPIGLSVAQFVCFVLVAAAVLRDTKPTVPST